MHTATKHVHFQKNQSKDNALFANNEKTEKGKETNSFVLDTQQQNKDTRSFAWPARTNETHTISQLGRRKQKNDKPSASNTHRPIHTHTDTHTHIHTHTHTQTGTHRYTHTHSHTHTQTRTHTHIHTHTYQHTGTHSDTRPAAYMKRTSGNACTKRIPHKSLSSFSGFQV